MKRTLLAALVPAALSIAGCGTFYAEAEQPEVCLTVLPQTFTIPGGGVVAPPEGFQGTFGGQVDLGISDAVPDFILNGPEQNHILRFLSMQASLAGSSGTANFDWLEDLSLTVSNGVTTSQLGFYSGGLPANSRVLKVGALSADNNLITFLKSGTMVLYLEGSVAVPGGAQVPASWTGSIQGCFYAKVKKTFDEIINSAK